MSQGQGGGRPPIWETCEAIDLAIDAYKAHCEEEKLPAGIYGFCEFVSVDPTTYYEYESGKRDTDEIKFSRTIKKIRWKAIADAEARSYSHTAGAVFNLVNLTRKTEEPWKNAQHQEVTGANG